MTLKISTQKELKAWLLFGDFGLVLWYRTIWSWTINNLKEFCKSNTLQDHIWNAHCSIACLTYAPGAVWSIFDLKNSSRLLVLDHKPRPKSQKSCMIVVRSKAILVLPKKSKSPVNLVLPSFSRNSYYLLRWGRRWGGYPQLWICYQKYYKCQNISTTKNNNQESDY